MSEQQDPTAPEDNDAKQAEADQKLNAVVKSHIRRELKALQDQLAPLKSLDKLIADAVTKSIGAKPLDDKSAADSKGGKQPDPAVARLQDELEKLKQQSRQSEEKARALEAKQRRDGLRNQMRAALEGLGIKGRKADSVIYTMEAEELVKLTEEGEPRFYSKRPRTKGAAPEMLEFDDIAAGIADWSKSAEAAEFLPAPNMGPGNRNAPAQAPRKAGTQKTYERPAQSDNEVVRRTVEQLESRGINVSAILDE